MTDAFPIAARGVYAEDFTLKGRRGFYAVDANGEQVAYRTVAKGKDPGIAISELWDELNFVDPIPTHASAPVLRLER